jgi:DNA repair protein RadC
VDFTNNAAAILKAFQKYRTGTPFAPEELLDHIIFNRTGYFSFLEEGKL